MTVVIRSEGRDRNISIPLNLGGYQCQQGDLKIQSNRGVRIWMDNFWELSKGVGSGENSKNNRQYLLPRWMSNLEILKQDLEKSTSTFLSFQRFENF